MGVGLLVVTFWVQLCTSYSSSCYQVQNGDILLSYNPGPPGKCPYTERIIYYISYIILQAMKKKNWKLVPILKPDKFNKNPFTSLGGRAVTHICTMTYTLVIIWGYYSCKRHAQRKHAIFLVLKYSSLWHWHRTVDAKLRDAPSPSES